MRMIEKEDGTEEWIVVCETFEYQLQIMRNNSFELKRVTLKAASSYYVDLHVSRMKGDVEMPINISQVSFIDYD
jgi:hypothetical protein